MKRIISASFISLIFTLITGCVSYGPGAQSNKNDRDVSETAVVATLGIFRGIIKDENEYTLQKEARDRLLNEHNSLTVWQTSF